LFEQLAKIKGKKLENKQRLYEGGKEWQEIENLFKASCPRVKIHEIHLNQNLD
jgi:hypothetical protein